MIDSHPYIRTNENKMLIYCIAFLGILLNQTSVVFGINSSISDVFLLLIIFLLTIRKEIALDVKPLIFFLIISFFVLSTATFYMPFVFEYTPTSSIIFGYLKLVAVLLYFFIGSNLERMNLMYISLKWFSIGALLIGVAAIVMPIFNMSSYAPFLFDRSIRFKGFMSDPNYFAILQILAIVYFWNAKDLRVVSKNIAVIILAVSILMSGSKTGMLALLFYISFKFTGLLLQKKFKYKSFFLTLVILIFIISVSPFLFYRLDELITFISNYIPAFNRVSILFLDFNDAVSGSGSGRDLTWNNAIDLIKFSPFFGIGVGTYTDITNLIWNIKVIAHNTYLQLAVEWGLPLAISFFVMVFYLLLKVTINKKFKKTTNIIYRDMLLILLIGSLAISLNNARIFWIILGALYFATQNSNILEKNIKGKIRKEEHNG